MNRPVLKTGGLVDFKQNLIFEEYKDRAIHNRNELNKEVIKKFGCEVSSELYRKITNYQIKKYDGMLSFNTVTNREYNKNFISKNQKWRRDHKKLCMEYQREQRILDSLEKRSNNGNK